MAMNISNKNYSEIGGLDFFLAHISDCLPYVILVSLGTVIGVIGSIYIDIKPLLYSNRLNFLSIKET